jgi:hypothetical protein
MTREEFWKMADSARTKEEYLVDQKLQYLQTASIETLRQVFVQYRFFTIYYIADLALLIFKVPFGKLRSVLGEILNDELGNTAEKRAHPYSYDICLRSIGVADDEMEGMANLPNITILNELRERMLADSPAYAIGLRGMGGECLCQVQLEAMHTNFLKNPYVAANQGKIDMAFWDIHAGAEDIHHREMMHDALDQVMRQHPEWIGDMAAGYWRAKRNFDFFWDNIFKAASAPPPEVVTTPDELAVFEAVRELCADSPFSARHQVQYKDSINFFSINLGTPESWFLLAFCDTAQKELTTRLSVERATELAPGFAVLPSNELFGKSRVLFDDPRDLGRLRRLTTVAYEEQVRRTEAQT